MADFRFTLSQGEIARQISALLNTQNKLFTTHTKYSILNAPGHYFVEVSDGKVVGCVCLVKTHSNLSLIKHLSVHLDYQRRGIASRLMSTAINAAETEIVYMTVRDDNLACLSLALAFNYTIAGKTWSRDHFVYTLGRSANANPVSKKS